MPRPKCERLAEKGDRIGAEMEPWGKGLQGELGGTYSFKTLIFGGVFGFSTGLVRLYIAGLQLRYCQTIGAPSVQGSAQSLYFRFW